MIKKYKTESGLMIIGEGAEIRPIAKAMFKHGLPFAFCDCPVFNDDRLYGLDYIMEVSEDAIFPQNTPRINTITAESIARDFINGYIKEQI